ncbi:MAG: hypothetical protein K9K64_07670 [Desulfohalobiaceae bacterium]|nr:hypothetical protein [Desulfohalobiaceae bacterium]
MSRFLLIPFLLAWFVIIGLTSLASGQSEGLQDDVWQTYDTAQDEGNEKDMQWFKKTMNISPKYQERTTGFLGMTWAHFIIMVFLIIFFAATIINYYTRSRRTKKILLSLLQEKKSQ